MQVETYEVISADPSQGDNALVNELESEEAQRLIQELGLSGQAELLSEKESGVTTRNPYREMTVIEDRVYSVLLPTRVVLAEYSAGPIPLRVLQVAAHAMEFFPRLEVWYEPGSRDDPLLVGCDNTNTWLIRISHLLARWGEVLQPFSGLVELAKPRLRAKWAKQVSDGLEERQSFLQTIDAQIEAHFAGHSVHVPT